MSTMVVLKHPRSVQKKLSGSSLAKLELERIRPREQVLGRPRTGLRKGLSYDRGTKGTDAMGADRLWLNFSGC